jgi:hypothetical protein
VVFNYIFFEEERGMREVMNSKLESKHLLIGGCLLLLFYRGGGGGFVRILRGSIL